MSESVWDAELLEDLCQVMEDSSICGLGQVASHAIRLTMRHFPENVGLIQSPIDNHESTAEN